MKRVVITGLGLVSPLGSCVRTTWSRILSKESEAQLLPSQYDKLPCRVASIINDEIYADIIKKSLRLNELKTMSRSSVLMMHAATEAVKHSNLVEMSEEEQYRCGVSIGIGFDGTDESVKVMKFNFADLPYNAVGPYALTRALGNMPCAHIGLRFKMKGPARSVNTACAAGLHAIGDAFRAVQYGEADVMLAGGVEASVTPWSIAAFSRIRALPTTFNDNPKAASRPFDIGRSGFVMAEGAGCVVLESLEHALKTGAQPLAEVLGFGQTCDAFSLVAPDNTGNGAYRAMLAALKWAAIDPTEVGYVNTHATSTPQGDILECKAVERLFGRKVPVSSFKGSLGHCLGGSGAVEAVLTIQSLLDGVIAPNTNLNERDPMINVNLVGESALPWGGSNKVAVTNAFGFGGTNCSLVIRQYHDSS